MPGAAGAVNVGVPLNGGDVSVVLGGASIGRAFIFEAHSEQVYLCIIPGLSGLKLPRQRALGLD